ncbi:FAD/NAD(P)-binding protein [Pseudonocardia sp. TRM90224]|uniref:FAD/NAD(P)-binding protein n=1 Tax=Pseudonocardia sp. TRM90224 TaxID=2812678 RepID=UPI001E4822F2|nr:FAD/NAD(P)-binding protein [Pseudonocardia sp. TRM90224]
MSSARIVIVGAGAAGALVTVRLAEAATGAEVVLVDPCADAGRGVAYATGDPAHLLNTPAGRMSAHPADPDHFVGWASRHFGRIVGAGEFLPRGDFGMYLGEVLGGAIGVRRVRSRAVGVEARRLLLSDGSTMAFDAAVFAFGAYPLDSGWAPVAVRKHPRFVANPWAPGALSAVPEAGDVLLVGTGLTMADVAITLDRPGRTVHAVSRSGLLPRVHVPVASARQSLPAVLPADLDSLRRLYLQRLRAGRDWRAAVDGLRPVTAQLWQGLSTADRARFLREDLRHWEVRRHRMAPATAARLYRMRAAGRLRLYAGEVLDASADLRVVLSGGQRIAVGAVIGCTGTATDLSAVHDPLLRSMFDAGLARRGPCGLGLDTAADGRLLPTAAPLWTLGAMRKGNLWETTAFPEIREQATTVAAAVAEHVARAAVRESGPGCARVGVDG